MFVSELSVMVWWMACLMMIEARPSHACIKKKKKKIN